MPKFEFVIASITPNTSNDNFTLKVTSGNYCMVTGLTATGEATSTTAMHTRFCKPTDTSDPSTATTKTAELKGLKGTANTVPVSAWSSTQPTLNAAPRSLLPTGSWNALGGSLMWVARDADDCIELFGAASANQYLSCRNSVGTGTSSYGASFKE